MEKPSVGFVHPDLGIGGAERLVVDAALNLQELGNRVCIFTSHFDANHAFEPTYDGTLQVIQAKTSIPRSFGSLFHLPMAIMQQLSLVWQVCFAVYGSGLARRMPKLYNLMTSIRPMKIPDVFVIDQLPTAIPLLKLLCARRVLYYCHFPDKEISTSLAAQRGALGPIRMLYRLPFNLLEEITTAFADTLVANSQFTSHKFQHAFPRIKSVPQVIYPGVDEKLYDASFVSRALVAYESEHTGGVQRQMHSALSTVLSLSDRPTLVSVNRFEAKKNIALAIDTVAQLRHDLDSTLPRLICAGGYDRRVNDNINTLAALQAQATRLGLPHVTIWCKAPMYEPPTSPPSTGAIHRAAVIFLPSLPGTLLNAVLLNRSIAALLYTPSNEHFGIVPLEAMACGVPVIATNTGGPLETVADANIDDEGIPQNKEITGFLIPPNAKAWAQACALLLTWEQPILERIAANAKQRVAELFSVRAMGESLDVETTRLKKMGIVTVAERAQIALLMIATLFLLGLFVFVPVFLLIRYL
ncbi:hypothetical protein MYAM1_000703 [Malassezia yamatoensis]|uniref:Alpha-1,3/1,6-mannosyltransferase ALG2 n=1 Tax=Malassezia yamatoensis TaxID=253288 RepID=A0AAJ5YQQ0_9BASI|nr:hypothetical protein MYAM1_000703 [Malassezia yamatoensis]